ncbi:uncharacterized protein FTJAE_12956 [Fusarium tjaetaba]|uniref:Homeobox domain-containing protein n=1 Tax=Fusarium tjaetaba TaxID=1567544 RepID=A0A8H5QLJ3_9HYPO|nr:uncharacterized protein FTJAE_12956 [Fusarium tjaetaba]KAF5616463.1 hypothetical protein FTJAE_12956 [Fusarium tjaetaba]
MEQEGYKKLSGRIEHLEEETNLSTECAQLPNYAAYLQASISMGIYSARRGHRFHQLTARTIESKPRLSKEEVEILEAEFQKNHKPGSSTKKALAESMRVDNARINNWFQNRRAREKKEKKTYEYAARQKLENEKVAEAAIKTTSEVATEAENWSLSHPTGSTGLTSKSGGPVRNEDATKTAIRGAEAIDEASDDSNKLSDTGDGEELAKPEETGQCFTAELPLKLLEEIPSRFPQSEGEDHGTQRIHESKLSESTAESSATLTTLPMDLQSAQPGSKEPAALIGEESHTAEQPLLSLKPREVGSFSWLMSWARKLSRPKLKTGFRRIEWKCDCGSDLYADFPECEGVELDKLEILLQSSGSDTIPTAGVQPESLNTFGHVTLDDTSKQQKCTTSANSPTKGDLNTVADANSHTEPTPVERPPPKFLALCVNTGGNYSTLTEIDTAQFQCDTSAFLALKDEYLRIRGQRARFWFLIKPTTVDFVQFTLWNLRHGYISVCSRPQSIPPHDSREYEYAPKPLRNPPPMPPEVFIHFLNHNEDDHQPGKRIWLPRLPKRLSKRVIDCDEGCEGWGIHVIEGPNRGMIFLVMILTIFGSVLATILWSAIRGDIPGGSTLGAFIVALPAAILTAFLLKLDAV